MRIGNLIYFATSREPEIKDLEFLGEAEKIDKWRELLMLANDMSIEVICVDISTAKGILVPRMEGLNFENK